MFNNNNKQKKATIGAKTNRVLILIFTDFNKFLMNKHSVVKAKIKNISYLISEAKPINNKDDGISWTEGLCSFNKRIYALHKIKNIDDWFEKRVTIKWTKSGLNITPVTTAHARGTPWLSLRIKQNSKII